MERRTTLIVLSMFAIGAIAAPAAVATVNLFAGGEQVSGDIVIGASNGPLVNVTNVNELELTDFTPNQNTVEVTSNRGNATLSSNGRTNVTLEAITGAWTNTSALNVTGADLTIAPVDKPAATVGGNATAFAFRTPAVDDSTTDFYYEGPSGTTTVTVRGLSATGTIAAVDTSSNAVLDVATVSSGSATFTMPNSAHYVTLQSSSGPPALSGSQATGEQSVPPTSLNVTVSDPDFPQDNVTVTFREAGTVLDTVNLSTAGSASVPYSNTTGGLHNITVNATDAYGQSTTETYTFRLPSELVIRNETNPSQIIDNETSLTITFYGQDGTVIQRSAPNGTVDLAGMPADQEFVVVAQADGYHSRTITVPSLIEQQTIYLLSENAKSVPTEFVLDDRTGVFEGDEDSKLRVQKAITLNNTTEYRTIVSDYFDSSGSITTILERDQRYRLIIMNGESTRVLGSYTASIAKTVPLTIGEVSYSGDVESGVAWGAIINTVTVGGNETRVTDISFVDPDRQLQSVDITYAYEDNGTVITQYTVSSPPERYNARLQAAPPPGETAIVTFEATFNSGETVTVTRPVGSATDIGDTGAIDPRLLSLIGFVGVTALTGLVVIYDSSLAGFVGVVAATAFTAIGVLNIPSLVLSFAGVAALVFLTGGES